MNESNTVFAGTDEYSTDAESNNSFVLNGTNSKKSGGEEIDYEYFENLNFIGYFATKFFPYAEGIISDFSEDVKIFFHVFYDPLRVSLLAKFYMEKFGQLNEVWNSVNSQLASKGFNFEKDGGDHTKDMYSILAALDIALRKFFDNDGNLRSIEDIEKSLKFYKANIENGECLKVIAKEVSNLNLEDMKRRADNLFKMVKAISSKFPDDFSIENYEKTFYAQGPVENHLQGFYNSEVATKDEVSRNQFYADFHRNAMPIYNKENGKIKIEEENLERRQKRSLQWVYSFYNGDANGKIPTRNQMLVWQVINDVLGKPEKEEKKIEKGNKTKTIVTWNEDSSRRDKLRYIMLTDDKNLSEELTSIKNAVKKLLNDPSKIKNIVKRWKSHADNLEKPEENQKSPEKNQKWKIDPFQFSYIMHTPKDDLNDIQKEFQQYFMYDICMRGGEAVDNFERDLGDGYEKFRKDINEDLSNIREKLDNFKPGKDIIKLTQESVNLNKLNAELKQLQNQGSKSVKGWAFGALASLIIGGGATYASYVFAEPIAKIIAGLIFSSASKTTLATIATVCPVVVGIIAAVLFVFFLCKAIKNYRTNTNNKNNIDKIESEISKLNAK